MQMTNENLPDLNSTSKISFESLQGYYRKSRLIQSLIQLIPYAGPYIDQKIKDVIENYNNKKLKVFFDELNAGSQELSEEVIQNSDFIYCYLSVVRAVTRTRRNEKIRYFARLLKASLNNSKFNNIDVFDEFLSILSELSYSELLLLVILAKFEHMNPPTPTSNKLQTAQTFWPLFTAEAAQRLSIQQDLLQPMLVRLQRSGFYQEFIGGYFDYTGGLGYITPLYYQLIKIIGEIDTEDTATA